MGLVVCPSLATHSKKNQEEQAAGDKSQARIKMEYRTKKDFFFSSE